MDIITHMICSSDLLKAEECLFDESKSRIGYTSNNMKWKWLDGPAYSFHQKMTNVVTLR